MSEGTSPISRPSSLSASDLAKLLVEQARVGASINQNGNGGGNGNGNGSLRSEFQRIVLAIAAFVITTLLGAVFWQINRVVDKQDDLVKGQASTNERLSAVEANVKLLIKEDNK